MDPLECLKIDPPPKAVFKRDIHSKIHSLHEKSLRDMAGDNSKMHYLNVTLIGLNGRHHPALGGIITTQDVKKCRIHLKMLAGDYFTYEVKANQSGGSPHCRCCPYPSPAENLEHILTSCVVYSDIRIRIKSEYEEACTEARN